MRRALCALLLLTIPTCAPVPPAAPIFVLPPIPPTAPTVLGPIEILVVPNLQCNHQPALGCFDGDARYLAIRDSVPRATQWQALRHEMFHAAMYYAGVEFKEERVSDRLADVVANQQVMEMVSGWPTPR